MLLSDTIVDFCLFYDGAVDIQIWALLTRSQCKVSDTQVTVKACGPLVCPKLWFTKLCDTDIEPECSILVNSPKPWDTKFGVIPEAWCTFCLF